MKEMDSFLMIGHIQDMAKIATKMVKESLDAFHQHDLKTCFRSKRRWILKWMNYLIKLKKILFK